MSTDEGRNDSANSVNLAESLPFSMLDSDVEFRDKPTYKTAILYGISDEAMYSAAALLNSEAGMILIHSAVMPSGWRYSVKKEALPKR